MPDHLSAPRTAADLLKLWKAGKEPPQVRRDEPHWYATIHEDGCVLCGARSGSTRHRMPGSPPADPGDRHALDYGPDWACSDHFL